MLEFESISKTSFSAFLECTIIGFFILSQRDITLLNAVICFLTSGLYAKSSPTSPIAIILFFFLSQDLVHYLLLPLIPDLWPFLLLKVNLTQILLHPNDNVHLLA